ncbi:transcription elongation factor GreA [Nesterenkonia lutea]|uniref:Transcription elongation factor GreA n=1 Tax=Nesterenkonia lutea TaxID=272919 RepID=A0ABR9JBK1_9MICC|nr:transcription elongation factor GreA [Nesterenkonia lutea]MBE1523313.1 transcription elongation factor GreA [Nesterenkonia lutea]
MSTNTPEIDENAQWLTQEAYDRLKGELAHLSGPGRQEIVDRIESAREEGDLKENGGYHAAKEEQGKAEARIRYLNDLLENSYVGDAPTGDSVVPGMLVEAKIAGNKMKFLFGNREIAGDTDLEVYSERSPIGEAINGTKPGDKLSYSAPNGKDIPVEIISAEPFKG